MTDPKLIEKYEDVYREGEDKFWTFDSREEQDKILGLLDFKEKHVLEIGCGTGDMAARISEVGGKNASVDAIDPCKWAIEKAGKKYRLDGLNFFNLPIERFTPQPYDVVIMIGVLEHVEDPPEFLRTIYDQFMGTGSVLATSSPCMLNPRGYIWVALQTLFKTPMSLTDKHVINPWDMEMWAKDIGFKKFKSNRFLYNRSTGRHTVPFDVDRDWGLGHGMIKDYEKRLRLALPNIPGDRIRKLLNWLHDGVFKNWHQGQGANMVYLLEK